jgi:translation initiation factor IF-2
VNIDLPRTDREQELRLEREGIEQRETRRKGRLRPPPEKSSFDAPKGKDKEKAKRRGRFVANDEDNTDEVAEANRRAEIKRQRKLAKAAKKAAAPVPILLPEYISVSNLASALKVRLEDFVEKLEELGFEETQHDFILSSENAGLIAMEYNYEAIIDKSDSEDLKARQPSEDPSILPQRPPVVTIMGHVDHGKTTLLDWLRKSSVAATEHGGITQHIGAFSVPMPSGKVITFLDTPGHAAFLSMRQRGANVTDIVILVVAADDSVKPQTIEAINHAKAAKVAMIVAINKIDKEDTNVERVKQDLARYGVEVEDFGGDTQVVCVSGKTGQGMNELEEAVVTLSEIIDMRAETDGPAEGWVLEASVKSMGKVATILVRRGTMRPGDTIVAGNTWAKIRCMRNEAGIEIEEAGPGTPVEIDGWREQPLAGAEVLQAIDEAKAKSVVDYRLEKEERNRLAEDMEVINEQRKEIQEKREREKADATLAEEAQKSGQVPAEPEAALAAERGLKEVFFVVKGDVSGSVEAVVDSIMAIGNGEVRPHILRSGVGPVSEFDIEHAAIAKGHVINFNLDVDASISRIAEDSKVKILDQNIIYRLVDDVKLELSKHLPPIVTQRVLGEAEIAKIFEITVKGRQQKSIAGCKIRNGTIGRLHKVRVLRDGEKIFDGKLPQLAVFACQDEN